MRVSVFFFFKFGKNHFFDQDFIFIYIKTTIAFLGFFFGFKTTNPFTSQDKKKKKSRRSRQKEETSQDIGGKIRWCMVDLQRFLVAFVFYASLSLEWVFSELQNYITGFDFEVIHTCFPCSRTTKMTNLNHPDKNEFPKCRYCKERKSVEELDLHENICTLKVIQAFMSQLSQADMEELNNQIATDQMSAGPSSSGRPASEHIRMVNITTLVTLVTGPVSSGKSTLTSHLMLLLGDMYENVSDSRPEKEAPLIKKISKLENMLEKLKTDHERGITIDKWNFETNKYSVTVNDVPGGREFTRDMISGAFKADCAVYVIDTLTEDYKAGFDKDGQAYEHAFLAFTLGVKQMICCLNKMDATTPSFSKDRYDEIKKDLSSYLNEVGYNTKSIPFIPIYGLNGDNLIERSKHLDWYKGPTLLEAVDEIKKPTSLYKPLRLPIQEVNKRGCIGRVESGLIKLGMPVTLVPIGQTRKVSALEIGIYKAAEAWPGDIVSLEMEKDVKDVKLQPGFVVSDIKEPATECLSLEAHLFVLNGNISCGFKAVLECHTSQVGIRFSKLKSKLDMKTGRKLGSEPKCITAGDLALVELIPTKPSVLVVEKVSDHPPLGRFLVRDVNTIRAIGVIHAVVRKDQSGTSSVKATRK